MRKESILIILHDLESATTEAYASFSGCIFYAVLHGSAVTMVCVDGDAHPNLPVGVFKRVCMLFASVFYSYIPVTIVCLQQAQESVM
jgi:hypothetical protein